MTELSAENEWLVTQSTSSILAHRRRMATQRERIAFNIHANIERCAKRCAQLSIPVSR